MDNINNYRKLAASVCKLAIKDRDFDFFQSTWFNDVLSYFVDNRIIDYVEKIKKPIIDERNQIVAIGYKYAERIVKDENFQKTFNLLKEIKL